ncbi:MAG: MoaD/ThiS family protein [Elusimicrobia bacterium]|nr:MoaD/ThiS family protein [Elusimicrobiota bacterium]
MAGITVMIYTTLRARLGFSKAELQGKTVHELLLKLAAVKKPDVKNILFDAAGRVKNHFVLTLNSELLDNRKAKTIKVKAGDILHIFPPISGG